MLLIRAVIWALVVITGGALVSAVLGQIPMSADTGLGVAFVLGFPLGILGLAIASA
jgi:hypothetical protein